MGLVRRDRDENFHGGGMERKIAAGCGIEKAYVGPSFQTTSKITDL